MKKSLLLLCLLMFLSTSCAVRHIIKTPVSKDLNASTFFTLTEKMTVAQYDSTVISCIQKGDFPRFMRYFTKVKVSATDSHGKKIKAHYYVSPDYICVGTDQDIMRTPLLPSSAQKIADMTGCFLSTPKIADDVYLAARIKIEPVPMMCERESHYTFMLHNMAINSQVKGRKSLVSGGKKDVVITPRLAARSGKLALYGWHKKDGKPIQPLYTGHADYYVDYSHGYRLVYRTVWVNGKKMDYTDVLAHDEYYRVLSSEKNDVFWSYPVECSCSVR
ncbi:MAG: hypothetical protein PHD21_08825 [Flavobacteriales bacterium]|nr:hypothetical protein [Flavobacteriales bacterium]